MTGGLIGGRSLLGGWRWREAVSTTTQGRSGWCLVFSGRDGEGGEEWEFLREMVVRKELPQSI